MCLVTNASKHRPSQVVLSLERHDSYIPLKEKIAPMLHAPTTHTHGLHTFDKIKHSLFLGISPWLCYSAKAGSNKVFFFLKA